MASAAFELRTLTFIDRLQPQLINFIPETSRVCTPIAYDAMLIIEIAPAMEIHTMLDMALKRTQVHLGALITERYFGQLFIQHPDQGEVIAAGEEIMAATGLDEHQRAKIELLTNKIIRNVEPDHASYFNSAAKADKITAGESVLIMETTPAAYLAIAGNEALKAARVKLIISKPFGSTGRLVMSGPEAEIDAAAHATLKIINILNEMRITKNYRQLN